MNQPFDKVPDVGPKVKTCSRCAVTGKEGEVIRRWSSLCKKCWNFLQQEKRRADPVKRREYQARAYQNNAEAHRAYARSYYQENKDDLRSRRNRAKSSASQKSWRLKNLDRARATGRKHDAKRKEERCIYRSQWVAKNPERAKETMRRWLLTPAGKASRRNSEIKRRIAVDSQRTATRKEIAALLTAAIACPYCGVAYQSAGKFNKSLDHIIAVVRGGPHSIENLMVCCLDCNRRKNRKTPEQWAAYLAVRKNQNPSAP